VEEAQVVVGDPFRSAVSDAGGSAHLASLPGRPLMLTVYAQGARTRDLGWLPIEVKDVTPEGQTLALTFRQGLRVTGRLVGQANRIGHRAVQVVKDGNVRTRAMSDEKGEFALVVDPERDFPLVIEASATPQAEFSLRLPLDRPPTQPVEIEVPAK
jgi:hypothetical protein